MKSPDAAHRQRDRGSLPVRGAWIEIASFAPRSYSRSVAPRAGSDTWVWFDVLGKPDVAPSLPVRGATLGSPLRQKQGCERRRSPCGERHLGRAALGDGIVAKNRRSPCGERHLGHPCAVVSQIRPAGRSPCGERHLGRAGVPRYVPAQQSLPVRGATLGSDNMGSNFYDGYGRSPCGERHLGPLGSSLRVLD